MEDREIVALFWERDEAAIIYSREKYGALLKKLAFSVLGSREDAEEAENDVYFKAWRSMPEDRPQHLGGYLAKIARNTAVGMYRRLTAAKRGGGEYALSLEELADCVTDGADPADDAERAALNACVNRFLDGESPRNRALFLQRYFYALSVREIAEKNGMTASNVKTTLSRLRGRLKTHLEQEGYR